MWQKILSLLNRQTVERRETMLQRVCEYLLNYFVESAHDGDYSIRSGAVSLPFAKDGQRVWIKGSSLCDGVYTYRDGLLYDDDDTRAAVGISDEDFHGTVCALAVPPSLLALVSEMREWESSHGDVINSPFQSENVIGVYSYTKASGGADSGLDPTIAQFIGRMRRWKKVSL